MIFDVNKPLSVSHIPEAVAAYQDAYRALRAGALNTDDSGVSVEDLGGGLKVMRLRGMLSHCRLGEDFYSADEVEKVLAEDIGARPFVLAIDSPGGDLQAAESLVRWFESRNPVACVIEGFALGAAYWLAATCPSVYLSSKTVMVGGIGVGMLHIDISVAEARTGVKTTEVAAGKYKTVGSTYRPLDKLGRSELQHRADYLCKVLVDDIERLRGRTLYHDGRNFIGTTAIDLGFAEGFKSVDDFKN